MRLPAVAPVARAVRNALAVSTLALALAAQAGAAPSTAGAPVNVVAPSPPPAIHDPSLVAEPAPGATPQAVATAVGLLEIGPDAIVHTDADIAAVAAADAAYAYAVVAIADPSGIGLLVNGGDLLADARAGDGDALAIGSYVFAEIASVFNDGSTTAAASAVNGDASATAVQVQSSYGWVENAGSLGATAVAEYGDASATGADLYGFQGGTIDNLGNVSVAAIATGGDADATGLQVIGVVGSAYAYNRGEVVVAATGDAARATGVAAASLYYGHGVVVNSGDVVASATGGIAGYGEVEATAVGLYGFALAYSSVVLNGGDVRAVATATAPMNPVDGFLRAEAMGIGAINVYGVFDTVADNDGDVTALATVSTGFATAWGVAARSSGFYGGEVVVGNDGAIAAAAYADIGVAEATGVYARNDFAGIDVVNRGDVLAIADTRRGVVNVSVNYATATGVLAASFYGDTHVDNHGDITAIARSYGAINEATGVSLQGASAALYNAAGATISALADAERFGLGRATGVLASGTYYAGVTNLGTVIAQGTARSFLESEYAGFYGAGSVLGIGAIANFQGDAAISNHGDVFAIAAADEVFDFFQGGAGAVGVHAYAKYDASVVNTGRIVATADTEFGIASAYGAVGEGKYNTDVVNQGEVFAIATAGSDAASAYGGRAVAMGLKVFHSDHALIHNDGLVVAQAIVTGEARNDAPAIASSWGAEIGYNSNVLDGVIDNAGRIESYARADFGYATAYGSFVFAGYEAVTVNSGDIVAVADALQGDAWAVGAFAYARHAQYYVPCDADGCDWGNGWFTTDGGITTLDNDGSIAAVAAADGGRANAYGAAQLGAYGAGIVNRGDLFAGASGDVAHAVGALANSSDGDAGLDNRGAIAARAEGATASAIGVHLLAGGDVTAFNTGTIVATAYGADASATALTVASGGLATLDNRGSVAAFGDGARIAIDTSAAAASQLRNAGVLLGAVRGGDGDDVLVNAADGTWFALGQSDFGAGGNRVDNAGRVVVRGGDIGIDLGGGRFTNTGILDLLDGATGDRLRIGGDFAGSGHLRVDANAVSGAADHLHITGDIAAGSVTTLDVNLLARPEAADFAIELVRVDGVSTAGNFALGDVGWQSALVTLDFDLRAQIAGTGADVFSLGVRVDGLTGVGEQFAALLPGVATLVEAQGGSWRQRMGHVAAEGRPAPALWLRTYTDSGDVSAAHHGFGAADIDFHQRTNGQELGIDFALTPRLSVGLLGGRSRASQDVGGGRNRFRADTVGLYATWQGEGGVYLDLSQRWSQVDVRLRLPGGDLATDVDAASSHLELGYRGWHLGGIVVSPQLQLTHTRIDGLPSLAWAGSDFTASGGEANRARVGLGFEHEFEAGGFTLAPYATLAAVHVFDDGQRHVINGGIVGETSLDGTSALLELGLGARRGGLALGAGLAWNDGGARDGFVAAQLTLRYAW
ncbi:autotransporter outer membrane beta-barrel domain-containing protein [Arenimonas composti]|uniref:autotransporter outer membrane beta-barrel domain-containing protein n=1 Tax=Arenimonas composti TaxID=370776 RepID=UPI0012B58CF7|nr:autotransporter outer membrane beta-barrel domain-containing protein [Arenimonas composti]